MFSKFTFTATVTNDRTGTTKTETGTVVSTGKQRARTDAANQVSSGDRDERVEVDDVRYSH